MAEVLYSTGIELPYAIERGRTNRIRCPVYRNGALVAPTAASSTCTVYDATNAAASTGAIVSPVASSVAEYDIPSLASLPYGDNWRVEWALDMPDGVVHTFRAGAALVRTAPHPEVSDASLFRRSSVLNPSNVPPLTKLTTFQNYIDEAWTEINRRLLQAGRRPWLVVDSTELREPHLLLSLALVYEDLGSRLNPAHLETAKMYRAQWLEAWSRVRLSYDTSDQGLAALTKRGVHGGGFWTNSRR